MIIDKHLIFFSIFLVSLFHPVYVKTTRSRDCPSDPHCRPKHDCFTAKDIQPDKAIWAECNGCPAGQGTCSEIPGNTQDTCLDIKSSKTKCAIGLVQLDHCQVFSPDAAQPADPNRYITREICDQNSCCVQGW